MRIFALRKKDCNMQRILAIFICLGVLGSCKGPSIKGQLDTYEQDLERKPKEIYELLKEVQKDKQHLTAEDEARLAILTLRAKDLAYIPLEGKDSIGLRKAIDYYDRKHDHRRLMQGYYLLGGVYRDIGDAPKGVETYMNVIEAADTTSTDCDYRIMARAMAQKADLQERQNVLPKAVESIQRAMHYALKGRDTTYYYDCALGIISQQTLLDNYEPLIHKSFQLIYECQEYGDTAMSVKWCVGYAWFYLQRGLTAEADSMLALYDRYNGRPLPIYYGTKGEAHLAHGRLDSAEWCFRKELEAADWNNQQTAYRGLKKVFAQRHQLDSALKYATLQCDAVDSDYQHKVSETIVQMEQVYNYEAEKEQAAKARLKQAQLQRMMAYLLTAIVLVGAGVIVAWQRRGARMRERMLKQEKHTEELKAQMAQVTVERNRAEAKLAKMETSLAQYQTEVEKQKNAQWRILQELDAERNRKAEAQEEQLAQQQRIQELEAEKRNGETAINALQKEIRRKEVELEEERQRIKDMTIDLEEFREEARQMANMTDAVKAMRKRMELGKAATTREWEAMQKEVNRLYPKFIRVLRKQVAGLNDTELHVAMLLKMGFNPSDISILTGLTPSAITKCRRRLYEKARGEEPNELRVADEWLMGVGEW